MLSVVGPRPALDGGPSRNELQMIAGLRQPSSSSCWEVIVTFEDRRFTSAAIN